VIVSGSRALFLDRDGVINHDAGYTSSAEDFQFIDGIFDLCRAARRSGYLLIVVTNQAGIGRGYYSEENFLTLTEWMRDRFEVEGAPISDVFYCPFHPEHGVGAFKKDSFDRKPNPGMLLRAAEKYEIDLKCSIMIGDKDSDMQAASQAGCGVRCHYLAGADEAIVSNAATHKIYSLREGILLLSESVATSEDA
jgi:D-glycero-D-manno-heptose 1,7-bisphosphate phosphatase